MRKRDNNETPLSGPWQTRFHAFLRENDLAPDAKAKYFVGWVGRLLQTANGDAAELSPEAVSAFLDELGRREEPWKVQQAPGRMAPTALLDEPAVAPGELTAVSWILDSTNRNPRTHKAATVGRAEHQRPWLWATFGATNGRGFMAEWRSHF